MASPLQPQRIDKTGIYGVIRQAEVDDSLIPDGAVTDVINFHFDRKGAATVRPGIAALGSTVLVSRPCVGLHNVQQRTAVAVFSNGSSSTIYSYGTSSAANAWAVSLDGGTASVRIRMVDFGSFSIAVNFIYNTYSSMRFWDGGTRAWRFTGNPINPQNMWGYAPQLGEVYKSRVYLLGDTVPSGSATNASNPSRLFFSSVISSTGNITWTPNVDYVDINPGDGENPTGLKRFSTELLVFKPNYIYRFRTSSIDPDPLVKIGTRSHESIVEGKRGMYFHHDTGFYRYSGGYPVEISRPISDIVDAIAFTQYDDIAGWNDSDHIYWFVGTLAITEVETVTLRNVVLRYTESADLWTVYTMANEPQRGITFNSGSTLSRIVGLDNGVVATWNSGTTDLGEVIEARLRTKWYELEGIGARKTLNRLLAVCEKAQGLELMYQIDEEVVWKSVGQLRKFINFFNTSITFHRIRFQIVGESRGEAAIFRYLELLEGINEGLVL